MTPEETKKIEKWFSEFENPKTKQKIELLKSNKKFLSDIGILRNKWNDFLKKYRISINNIEKTVFKAMQKKSLKKEPTPKINKAELKNLSNWAKIINGELFENIKLGKDIFNLCQKYKLYPIDLWQYSLLFFILTNNFEQPNIWAGLKLSGILSAKELLLLPKNMNFDIETRKNKKTKEEELFVHIFESTSWRDLKKYWKVINYLQKKLKKDKCIGKRYYPRKNSEIEKQLRELDKTNLSDWEKQEKIYEEISGKITGTNFGKEENKRRRRIETIRHRQKKRTE